MPTECAYTLPTGRKCRCMATRHHAFCRHHGAPGSNRPRRDPNLWSRRACWRDVGRSAATMPIDEAALGTLDILRALLESRIADRTAGRLLRTLLVRCGEVPLTLASETGWTPPAVPPAAGSLPHPQPSATLAGQPGLSPVNQAANLGDLQQMLDQILSMPVPGRR